jgi:O-antigen/teichoic acid export membrane protein
LPKEDFGVVAMALFVVQLSTIFVDMGMNSAILHKQNISKKEYSSIFWLNIFISFLFYLLMLFLAPLAAEFYREEQLSFIIPVLGLNILLMASGRQHRTIMQKQFKFDLIAKIELLSFFIGLISAVCLALYGYEINSLIYSTLISSLASNLLFLLINLRLNPILFRFNIREATPFLRIGGFSMGASLLDFFAKETDILIIGRILGSESLGLYTLAKQIVLKLYVIVNPIVLNVLSPILSSIQNDKNLLKEYYLKIVYFLAHVNFPIYLLLVIFSKETLIIIYGKEYVSGFLIVVSLSISYAINSISNPVGSLQIATGRTDLGFQWTLLRVFITPVAMIVASKFGINAVAGSLAILSFLFVIPMWKIQLKPMLDLKFVEYLNQFYVPLFIVLILTFFFLFFNVDHFVTSTMFIFVKIFVSLVSYFSLLYLLDKKAIAVIRQFLVFRGLK